MRGQDKMSFTYSLTTKDNDNNLIFLIYVLFQRSSFSILKSLQI